MKLRFILSLLVIIGGIACTLPFTGRRAQIIGASVAVAAYLALLHQISGEEDER